MTVCWTYFCLGDVYGFNDIISATINTVTLDGLRHGATAYLFTYRTFVSIRRNPNQILTSKSPTPPIPDQLHCKIDHIVQSRTPDGYARGGGGEGVCPLPILIELHAS